MTELQTARCTMETIALINQKGGVGKTTSTANIGSGLTILGKRVLLVDLDPQAHLARTLGIDTTENRHSIYNVLRGDIEPSRAFRKKSLGARLSQTNSNGSRETERLFLTVLPSSLELSNADAELSHLSDREYLLKVALEPLSSQFDYVLIDCPPGLGFLSESALTAARRVDIPVQTEYLALEGLRKLVEMVDRVKRRSNNALEIGGIIATRFDGRKLLNREVVDRLKAHFGDKLFKTLIRENISLAEAPSYGEDIFTFHPRSHGAQDYLRLCEEILERSWRHGH